MSSLDTAQNDVNILDWNNCKSLDVFVNKFKLAQVLESKIDQFNENFLRSKLISDEELLEMEGINWLLYKISSFGFDSEYFVTIYDVFCYDKIFNDSKIYEEYQLNKIYQEKLLRSGLILWTPLAEDLLDKIFKYKISIDLFSERKELWLLEHLSRLRYESTQQLRFTKKFPELTREINESLRDEQEFIRMQYRSFFKKFGRKRNHKDYFILSEFGQPLPVTNDEGFKHVRMKITDNILHCYVPLLGKCIYGYSPLVLNPKGLLVHLEFDVYTNNLIKYEARGAYT